MSIVVASLYSWPYSLWSFLFGPFFFLFKINMLLSRLFPFGTLFYLCELNLLLNKSPYLTANPYFVSHFLFLVMLLIKFSFSLVKKSHSILLCVSYVLFFSHHVRTFLSSHAISYFIYIVALTTYLCDVVIARHTNSLMVYNWCQLAYLIFQLDCYILGSRQLFILDLILWQLCLLFFICFRLQCYKKICLQFMIFGRTALGIIAQALLCKGNLWGL